MEQHDASIGFDFPHDGVMLAVLLYRGPKLFQVAVEFFELALSMESYPSAPPASLAAQIEQQAASRPNPDPAAALVAYGSSQRWASIDCRMCVITLHSAPVPL